jgi:hypothetical protein
LTIQSSEYQRAAVGKQPAVGKQAVAAKWGAAKVAADAKRAAAAVTKDAGNFSIINQYVSNCSNTYSHRVLDNGDDLDYIEPDDVEDPAAVAVELAAKGTAATKRAATKRAARLAAANEAAMDIGMPFLVDLNQRLTTGSRSR